MNVYERILNILLEARVDMFIQDRLDEASPEAKRKRELIQQYKGKRGGPKTSTGKTPEQVSSGASEHAVGFGALDKAAKARQQGDISGAWKQIRRAGRVSGPYLN